MTRYAASEESDFYGPTMPDETRSRIVCRLGEIVVLTPRNPLHDLHFLLFTPDDQKVYMHELSSSSARDMQEVVRLLHERCLQLIDDYAGYNEFSNNGSKHAGQDLPHAHKHVVFRYGSEPNSPFGPRKEVSAEHESWVERIARATSNINRR